MLGEGDVSSGLRTSAGVRGQGEASLRLRLEPGAGASHNFVVDFRALRHASPPCLILDQTRSEMGQRGMGAPRPRFPQISVPLFRGAQQPFWLCDATIAATCPPARPGIVGSSRQPPTPSMGFPDHQYQKITGQGHLGQQLLAWMRAPLQPPLACSLPTLPKDNWKASKVGPGLAVVYLAPLTRPMHFPSMIWEIQLPLGSVGGLQAGGFGGCRMMLRICMVFLARESGQDVGFVSLGRLIQNWLKPGGGGGMTKGSPEEGGVLANFAGASHPSRDAPVTELSRFFFRNPAILTLNRSSLPWQALR